MLGKVK